MIAAVHLSLHLTVPLLVATAVVLGWYWRRLGEADVPASRRGIRRASLLLMFIGLLVAASGLSLIDSDTQGRGYVMTWVAVMALVIAAVITAVLDILNNVRLHRQHYEHRIDLLRTDLERIADRGRPTSPRDDEA